jgi:hypothetical protein
MNSSFELEINKLVFINPVYPVHPCEFFEGNVIA